MKIKDGDFNDLKVLELLRLHLSGMQENSPPKSVHALDLTGLQSTDISFWTVWSGDDLMGCGALKRLSADRAEIKSMRTHAHHMRKGVGAYLLEYIIANARRRGFSMLSLETGSGPAFMAALGLYRKYGFENGAAFADYELSEFNQFLHLKL